MLLNSDDVACITDTGIDIYIALVIVGHLYHKHMTIGSSAACCRG